MAPDTERKLNEVLDLLKEELQARSRLRQDETHRRLTEETARLRGQYGTP